MLLNSFCGLGWPERGALGRLAANLGVSAGHLLLAAALVAGLECVHSMQEQWGSLRRQVARWPAAVRWPAYYAAVAALVMLGVYDDSRFIYFQF